MSTEPVIVLRSPWRFFNATLGIVGAGAMAAFVPDAPNIVEPVVFAALAATCVALAIRAFLAKVVLGDQLSLHAIWTTRRYRRTEIQVVTGEVLEDRFLLVMWVPTVHLTEEDRPVRALMGYSLMGHRNKRVDRQVEQFAAWLGRTANAMNSGASD
jgi:hypothetical protein